MSRTRTAPRPTAHPLERLVARRRAARSQQELRAALAGAHGAGVRADVLAAMRRSSPNGTAKETASAQCASPWTVVPGPVLR